MSVPFSGALGKGMYWPLGRGAENADGTEGVDVLIAEFEMRPFDDSE